jgi:hypothetical protein
MVAKATTVRTNYEETSQRRRPNISLLRVITRSCSESVEVEVKKVHVGVIFLRAQFSSFFFFITSNVHY